MCDARCAAPRWGAEEMKTSWWKDGLVRSLPWLVVPPGLAGFVAWVIMQQPPLQATAEARIDALANGAGVFAGIGLVWSFARAYKGRHEAHDRTSPARPNWKLLGVGVVGIGLGVFAANSAAAHRATSHYGPDSSIWPSFVNGCLKNCRQSTDTPQLCDSYCECSAQTFFGTTVMRDVDAYFKTLANGRTTADIQQRLDDIGKTCAANIRG